MQPTTYSPRPTIRVYEEGDKLCATVEFPTRSGVSKFSACVTRAEIARIREAVYKFAHPHGAAHPGFAPRVSGGGDDETATLSPFERTERERPLPLSDKPAPRRRDTGPDAPLPLSERGARRSRREEPTHPDAPLPLSSERKASSDLYEPTFKRGGSKSKTRDPYEPSFKGGPSTEWPPQSTEWPPRIDGVPAEEIVGSHTRKVLMGRLAKVCPPGVLCGAAASELQARGYDVSGFSPLKRLKKGVRRGFKITKKGLKKLGRMSLAVAKWPAKKVLAAARAVSFKASFPIRRAARPAILRVANQNARKGGRAKPSRQDIVAANRTVISTFLRSRNPLVKFGGLVMKALGTGVSGLSGDSVGLTGIEIAALAAASGGAIALVVQKLFAGGSAAPGAPEEKAPAEGEAPAEESSTEAPAPDEGETMEGNARFLLVPLGILGGAAIASFIAKGAGAQALCSWSPSDF